MSSSHDTKGNIRLRKFLSFVLCVLIIFLSLSVCTKTAFTSASYIEKQLTSYEYVSGYRENVIEYAEDVFMRNGIPADNLENVITQDMSQTLAQAYINSIIKAKPGYTADTVSQNIDILEKAVTDEIKTELENTGYKYNKTAAQDISQRISSYADDELSIPAAGYLETIVNIGSVASTVLSVVLAIFAAVLALILFFVGAKRYRSVRAIGISFMSAGFFDLILSLLVIIISSIKHVDIYPLYLQNAFMSYVYGSIGAVALSGAILLLISLVFVTIVWKMKREEK